MSKHQIETINSFNLSVYVELSNFSWSEIIQFVRKFQKRIYQAACVGDSITIRYCQNKLIFSQQASLLAIRHMLNRHPQDRKSFPNFNNDFSFVSNTNFFFTTYLYQLLETKEYTLINLAIQELLLLALRPEWEARGESNSYGFSSTLAVNQAIIKTCSFLSQNNIYENSFVLVGRLNNFFEQLNLSLVLKKSIYNNNLKNGLLSIIDNSSFSSSLVLIGKNFQYFDIVGFSYNSIALLLANLVFYGLENSILWQSIKLDNYKRNLPQTKLTETVAIICSSHFVVIFPSKNLRCIALTINSIRSFFSSIGINLHLPSLKVNSIHEGFDFLGFNFRCHRRNESSNTRLTKLIIKPTQKNIKKHLLRMRYCLYHKDRLNRWRANAQMTQHDVINRLNPLIKDFSLFYGDLIPYSVLKTLDRTLNEMIYRYAIKKYKSDKSQKWASNWTAIINGKKMIAYTNGNKKEYTLLYLHSHDNFIDNV
uniref:putative reverse transcriptase/maturase n=1 Tax=Sahlingia subintegra TaxID=468936 RepID=UPI001FCE1164|nr:putative reverse transcriptase/maturase [Sahlingia subintegra]UNJ17345.1 putative reverse transcriptase/maturase [Sahlingia subintegra]